MQQTLGKYQLGEQLGQGGMGAVFRSFHPQLNRPVAIKVMLANVTADPQARQRFLREAQVVAALAHPNIVNIFDVDVQAGQPYIVMDFVEGGSLAARLASGPLPVAEALRLAIPLAEALEYAHGQGVIHRDLKPANVLLRRDGTPVLADFGLARPLAGSAAQITAAGAVLGTLAYMAPEQFAGRAADMRSDVYAFGVMLYEMLTGRVPFDGDSAQVMYGHLQQPPPAPRGINSGIPIAVERLLLRMLAKDPADRPQSMAQVAGELRAVQSGAAATGPTIALPANPPRPLGLPFSRRWLVAIFLALPALAALCGLALLFPLTSPRSPASALPTSAPALARPTTVEFDPSPTPWSTHAPQATPMPSPTAPPPARVDAPLASLRAVGPETFSVGGVTYRRNNDALWFFGEVRNDGSQPRETIAVRVNLLDGSGKEIASKNGYAAMSYLKPGEVAPFSVLFNRGEAPAEFATYALEVRSDAADFQVGYTYRELSIAGDVQARRDEYGFVELNGRVRNDGARPAKYVQIYAVFYDTEGLVVGLANAYAETSGDAPLAAGADARFELQGVVFTGQPARYRLFAEGSR